MFKLHFDHKLNIATARLLLVDLLLYYYLTTHIKIQATNIIYDIQCRIIGVIHKHNDHCKFTLLQCVADAMCLDALLKRGGFLACNCLVNLPSHYLVHPNGT